MKWLENQNLFIHLNYNSVVINTLINIVMHHSTEYIIL